MIFIVQPRQKFTKNIVNDTLRSCTLVERVMRCIHARQILRIIIKTVCKTQTAFKQQYSRTEECLYILYYIYIDEI